MAHYGTVHSSSSAKLSSRSVANVEETDSLLSHPTPGIDEDNDNRETGITARYLILFYVSHALFMWNNRCYEFAAVLFTASAFPHTLVQASIRALCAHLASVLFSPAIGRWLNRYLTSLWPVQGCIAVQRLCITLASLGFIPLMIGRETDADYEKDLGKSWSHVTPILFGLLILLGMVERLSAVGNLAIVERQWLPLLSTKTLRTPIDTCGSSSNENAPADGYTATQDQPESNLHILNATTKRIDLITKLVAPLAVSRLVISTDNIKTAAFILAMTQALSCGIELYSTKLVWHNCKAFHEPRSSLEHGPREQDSDEAERDLFSTSTGRSLTKTAIIMTLPLFNGLRSWYKSFAAYLRNPIALPSLAYILEPFSVLTLAGSMTAYLLAANFSLADITLARTASTIVEIASTVLTPLMISCFSRGPSDQSSNSVRPLIAVGIVGLAWQLMCLLPVTIIFTIFPDLDGSTAHSSYMLITALLFAGLALSRLGPFAYSLVEQQLVQVRVAPSERIEFSSVETALFDVAELARWFMLMIFSTTKDFRWAALLSFGSVVSSFVMAICWARRA